MSESHIPEVPFLAASEFLVRRCSPKVVSQVAFFESESSAKITQQVPQVKQSNVERKEEKPGA